MARKQKYYVVWQGNEPGVYDNWEDCKKQVTGVSAAKYKSFESLQEAQAAFQRPYNEILLHPTLSSPRREQPMVDIDENGMTVVHLGSVPPPVLDSLAVDAACSGNPGMMEYQGVYVANRQQLFHFSHPRATNNIGEFLAIVHGLAYLKQHHLNQILYIDSKIALSWVRRKECRTKLPLTPQTADLWNIIRRAEAWLQNNSYITEIRKWDTDHWGEIPADFGRK